MTTKKAPQPVTPGQTWQINGTLPGRNFMTFHIKVDAIDGDFAICRNLTVPSLSRPFKMALSTLRRGLRGAKLVEPEGVTT